MLAIAVVLVPLGPPAFADDPAGPGKVDFIREVRPILAKNCFGCHGPDEKARKAKLRLDLEGGAKAVIVPGEPDASDLVKRITRAADYDRDAKAFLDR